MVGYVTAEVSKYHRATDEAADAANRLADEIERKAAP
jgi:hypothetical protein